MSLNYFLFRQTALASTVCVSAVTYLYLVFLFGYKSLVIGCYKFVCQHIAIFSELFVYNNLTML